MWFVDDGAGRRQASGCSSVVTKLCLGGDRGCQQLSVIACCCTNVDPGELGEWELGSEEQQHRKRSERNIYSWTEKKKKSQSIHQDIKYNNITSTVTVCSVFFLDNNSFSSIHQLRLQRQERQFKDAVQANPTPSSQCSHVTKTKQRARRKIYPYSPRIPQDGARLASRVGARRRSCATRWNVSR